MNMTPREKHELGMKRHEQYWEIRGCMHRAGFSSEAELARKVGKTNTIVYRTLRGSLHTPEVLDVLRNECAVPEKLLFDPRTAFGSAAQ